MTGVVFYEVPNLHLIACSCVSLSKHELCTATFCCTGGKFMWKLSANIVLLLILCSVWHGYEFYHVRAELLCYYYRKKKTLSRKRSFFFSHTAHLVPFRELDRVCVSLSTVSFTNMIITNVCSLAHYASYAHILWGLLLNLLHTSCTNIVFIRWLVSSELHN